MFPFELEIQRKRVKYMRIKVLSSEKVLLTLPWYVPKGLGIKFVEEKQQWIQKTLHKRNEKKLHEFSLLGELYELELSSMLPKGKIHLERDTMHIGAKNETEAKTYFQKYLRETAKKILPTELFELSRRYDLPYGKVSLRSQKTRWGSCSREKNISLNIALAKLSKELREYVLIHELCHTKEMNHSHRFWALVEKYCPNHREFRKELKKYGLSVS